MALSRALRHAQLLGLEDTPQEFHKEASSARGHTIKHTNVCRVTHYDYLRTTITEELSWNVNTERLASEAMKRLLHLCKLLEFYVKPQFYHSIVTCSISLKFHVNPQFYHSNVTCSVSLFGIVV